MQQTLKAIEQACTADDEPLATQLAQAFNAKHYGVVVRLERRPLSGVLVSCLSIEQREDKRGG